MYFKNFAQLFPRWDTDRGAVGDGALMDEGSTVARATTTTTTSSRISSTSGACTRVLSSYGELLRFLQ